jgi:hypothetical protein
MHGGYTARVCAYPAQFASVESGEWARASRSTRGTRDVRRRHTCLTEGWAARGLVVQTSLRAKGGVWHRKHREQDVVPHAQGNRAETGSEAECPSGMDRRLSTVFEQRGPKPDGCDRYTNRIQLLCLAGLL